MARTHRSLGSILAHWLVGALIGGVLGALGYVLVVALAPGRLEARALFLHSPLDGGPADAARVVSATLAREDFLPEVVGRHELDTRSAGLLASRLRVVTTAESTQLAQLILYDAEAAVLERVLNAVADDMAALYDQARHESEQSTLRRLDDEIAALTRRQAELEARRQNIRPLPGWARNAVVTLTNLASRRIDLELAGRYPRSGEAQQAPQGRAERIASIAAQEAQLRRGAGGEPNVEAAAFDLELEMAVGSAHLLALLQTKQALLGEFALARGPLRVVQHAQVSPRPLPRSLLAGLTLAAALLGALGGGVVHWLRTPAQVRLSGPIAETDLRTRVVGVMASALTHYGERKMRPLAQTHPEHLAIAGVRSLSLALHLLLVEHGRGGPVVVAEVGAPRHATHVLANLAMLAADRGERVLLVEAQPGASELSTMFKSGTETTLSTTFDVDEFEHADTGSGRAGRIRFVAAQAETEQDAPTALPVPGALVNHFDRVYIHAADIAQACSLLDGYGAGIGILVSGNAKRLAALREARRQWLDVSPTLHGVVLCGYRIDESAYAG